MMTGALHGRGWVFLLWWVFFFFGSDAYGVYSEPIGVGYRDLQASLSRADPSKPLAVRGRKPLPLTGSGVRFFAVRFSMVHFCLRNWPH